MNIDTNINIDKTLSGIFNEKQVSLKWMEIEPKIFLNNTITIYGRRNSGKSTLVIDIMHALKDHISLPFIISQTSTTNNDFKDIVPEECIKNNADPEWLIELLNLQQNRSVLYNKGNDINLLKSIFDKLCDQKGLEMEKRIKYKTRLSIENIKRLNSKYEDEVAKIKELKCVEVEHLRKIYKISIRRFKTKLADLSTITKDERICIDYIDFQPHLLLIIDDCASVLKKWAKESTVIKQMFYNGRHNNITLIVTAQDDKELDPELRKNALISIFTNSQAAISNFNRSANSYTKQDKERANACIDLVFRQTDPNITNYKKLIYLQSNYSDSFRYTIASKYDPFRIGCNKLWILKEKIENISNKDKDGVIREFLKKYN